MVKNVRSVLAPYILGAIILGVVAVARGQVFEEPDPPSQPLSELVVVGANKTDSEASENIGKDTGAHGMPEGNWRYVAQTSQTTAQAGPTGVGSSGTSTNTSDGFSTSAQAASSQEPTGLEEIIVTARRREENIQAVPEQIVVISQDQLRDNNVHDFQDLQYLVPSLTSTAVYTNDGLNINIRGQGVNESGIPGVVVYINEVPLLATQTSSGEYVGGAGLLFDLENVQVLEGAQGTLFGRNAVGGAVLLQTARPKNEFGGDVEVSYGNYNDREVNGAVNIPIIDNTLLARVAFTTQQRDGYTHVLSEPSFPNGVDADNVDFYALRGTVTFRPNDQFQNDTIATYTASSNHGGPLILDAVNPPLVTAIYGAPYVAPLIAGLPQQQALGPYTAVPIDTNLISTYSVFALENISRLNLTDTVTFRNIVGVNRVRQDFTLDSDGTTSPIGDNINGNSDAAEIQYSEEAQLLGNSFGNRLNWIVGLFYVDEYNLFPFILAQYAQPNAGGSFAEFTNYFSYNASSRALYGQATYDLSALVRNLKFTAGYRYTWDFDSLFNGYGFGPISSAPLEYLPASSSAPGWTLSLDEQLTPELLVYVASHHGYRNGGANDNNVTGVAQPTFGPEYVTDGDIGIKSDWRVGSIRLRANADIFYEQYYDVQNEVTTVLPNGQTEGITANAGTARLWGTEFMASAQLTDALEIGATFDSLNFRITEYPPGTTAAQASAFDASDTNQRPPYKYGVNAKYHLPLAPSVGDITAKAYWNWQASQSIGATLPLIASQGDVDNSFGLLNLSVDWNKIAGSSFDASLFGANVLNKVHITSGNGQYNLVGLSTERFGEPRMYGIRLRYRFGAEAR